jgi:signal transduction histidine kinase
MIVHDIKNPLCGASGFAQLIQHKVSDKTISGYADTILEALEQVERICLEFSASIEGESSEPVISSVSLSELIGELVGKYSEAYQLANIALTIECPESIMIAGDKFRLRRALSNVFNNAREAMPNGGELCVSVSLQHGAGHIVISDNGAGIPAYILPHVFEPFFSWRKPSYAGLGLSFAKSIIENHGGSISIESSLQKGTRIYIVLPTTKED